MGYIVIGICLIIIIYILIIYNSIVKLSNRVEEAFSTMDIYMKKRWDLIPNLVETVKQYTEYEKETIKEIVKLRSLNYETMTLGNKIDTNYHLAEYLPKIMLISEAYPELKANKNFLKLSDELVKVEDEIANSRKYYNGTVRIYNNKVEIFPNNVIAKIFRFKEKSMFEISTGEKENIKVDVK